MTSKVNPVPEGFHTMTPYVTIKGVAGAIEFYKEAFGAKEIFRWADPDGSIRHAEIVIGDSPVMITDEAPKFGMAGPQSHGGSPVLCSSTSRTWTRLSSGPSRRRRLS